MTVFNIGGLSRRGRLVPRCPLCDRQMMYQDGVCGCCATTFKPYLATLRTPRAPGRLELIDRLRAQIRADAAPAEIRRQPVRSMPPERTICAETAGIVPASAACGDAMAPDTPASNAPISPKKRSFARSQGNRARHREKSHPLHPKASDGPGYICTHCMPD